MTMAVSKAKAAVAESGDLPPAPATPQPPPRLMPAAGHAAFVIIPETAMSPRGNLAQALVYGAEVLAVKGNFDRPFRCVRELAIAIRVTPVNSVKSLPPAGQKTAAFEVVDALVMPRTGSWHSVGNAGNITPIGWVFRSTAAGPTAARPAGMIGLQSAGSAPLVAGPQPWSSRHHLPRRFLRIGNPANRERPVVREQSGGAFRP